MAMWRKRERGRTKGECEKAAGRMEAGVPTGVGTALRWEKGKKRPHGKCEKAAG
jgi:hypothetical protein